MDLGSRYLKSVVLQAGRSCPTLMRFSMVTVDPRPSQDSRADFKKEGNMFQVLRDHLTPFPKNVGISVSVAQVLLKNLTLPVMREPELREHLGLELDRYIPLDVQDVAWDVYCHKVPVFFKDEKSENFLIVAKKEFIANRIQQFEQQGMKVSFVDVDSFALVNMVAYNYGDEGTWLIVHLGPTGILTVTMEGGEPVYIRQVSYEAEWYGDLIDRVLLAHEKPDEGYKLGTSEALLLEQFFDEITNQVFEALRHFSDISGMGLVPGVLLSGGFSGLEGFPTRLANSLKMPVSLVEPFKKITVPPAIQQDTQFQKALPLLGVAVGLALRGVMHHD